LIWRLSALNGNKWLTKRRKTKEKYNFSFKRIDLIIIIFAIIKCVIFIDLGSESFRLSFLKNIVLSLHCRFTVGFTTLFHARKNLTIAGSKTEVPVRLDSRDLRECMIFLSPWKCKLVSQRNDRWIKHNNYTTVSRFI